jgi:uncharacterized membrane protein YdjX (TVP38/TMEM64 family)
MITNKLLKLVFILVWVIVFYNILFNTLFQDTLLIYSNNNKIFAPLLLILMQIVLASFILPCSAIAVLAGILWGVEIGILYSLLATICASSWTFVVGRFFIKDWNPSKNIFSWYAAVVNLINSHNWKASMVAHANPLFPGSSLGYIFGLSRVGYGNFLFGLIIGTLPLQILAVSFGYFSNRVINLSVDYVVIVTLFMVIMAIFLYIKMIPRILGYIERDL